MPHDYDIYIFDLDGTLLDTVADLAASVNHALRAFALPERTVDEVRQFVGNGVRKLVERSLAGGTEHPLYEAVFAVFKEHYLLHGTALTRPYDGITAMLERLQARGKAVAVVSNKYDAATKRLCRHYFGDLIDVAIGEREGVKRKPSPDTIVEVLRHFGKSDDEIRLGRCNAVYVGDTDVDLAVAQNSCLPCISVLWGFRSKDFLVRHGASLFAATPAEIA